MCVFGDIYDDGWGSYRASCGVFVIYIFIFGLTPTQIQWMDLVYLLWIP